MDNRNSLLKKINLIAQNSNIYFILGASIFQEHVINFFNTLPGENGVVLCFDIQFDNKADYCIEGVGNKRLIQVICDFNTIGPWKIINDNLVRKQINPKQVIIDWSTAKFIDGRFSVNSEYGDVMKILIKWITIFSCEIYSPCAYETIYYPNSRFKEPQYYNFFLYRTQVPLTLDHQSINLVWIEKFTDFLNKEHKNVELYYVESGKGLFPLVRKDKDIKEFFKLAKKI